MPPIVHAGATPVSGTLSHLKKKDMTTDMQQGNFSHAKCQACGHMALIDKFNPTLVDLQDCNLPNISFEVTETKDSPVKLQTVNMNCPICTSPFVEAIFPNEVN